MTKITLAPDDFELKTAMANVLAPCPFCGRHPLMRSEQNEQTGYYVVSIFCPDCYASMSCCQETRTHARSTVISRWSQRA